MLRTSRPRLNPKGSFRNQPRSNPKRSNGDGTLECVASSRPCRPCSCCRSGGCGEGRGHDKPFGPGEANVTANSLGCLAREKGVIPRRSRALTRVLVLGSTRQPLMPCHPARARELLKSGKAAIFRRYPFTIILKNRADGDKQSLQLKISPGTQTTGLAIVGAFMRGWTVVWAAELKHRGNKIHEAMLARKNLRMSRRGRKTRYRKKRLDNRRRSPGWLPPSLLHRVETTMTWVKRLCRWSPITGLSTVIHWFEPEFLKTLRLPICEYPSDERFQHDLREYIGIKGGLTCKHCGMDVNSMPGDLQRSIINEPSILLDKPPCCRADKADKKEPLHHEHESTAAGEDIEGELADEGNGLGTPSVVVYTVRRSLFRHLQDTGLPVESGTDTQTSFNRNKMGLARSQWANAVCVGETGDQEKFPKFITPLIIKSTGHGNRQMCCTNKYGFPIRHRSGTSVHFGFRTGDIVRADVPKGKKSGIHIGRLLARANGYCDIKTTVDRVTGISFKYCHILHKMDGYSYS